MGLTTFVRVVTPLCVTSHDWDSINYSWDWPFLLAFVRRRNIQAVISLSVEVKNIDVGSLLTFRIFFFFGWCPMFLVDFVCDFFERRGEKPSASTRVCMYA